MPVGIGENTATKPSSLLHTLMDCWPLLFGMGLVMIANGLQGSLLGLRAILEGFSPAVTGLVMSGYFMGYTFGSLTAPGLLRRVGHVRVFGALTSVVSISALTHVLFLSPPAWLLMRFATGFCLSGLFVVSESWLNDRIENTTRGQLLGAYMVVVLGGLGNRTFFGCLCLLHSTVGLYTWYRIKTYPAVPTEDQGSYMYLARTSQVSAATAYGDESQEEVPAGADA